MVIETPKKGQDECKTIIPVSPKNSSRCVINAALELWQSLKLNYFKIQIDAEIEFTFTASASLKYTIQYCILLELIYSENTGMEELIPQCFK